MSFPCSKAMTPLRISYCMPCFLVKVEAGFAAAVVLEFYSRDHHEVSGNTACTTSAVTDVRHAYARRFLSCISYIGVLHLLFLFVAVPT